MDVATKFLGLFSSQVSETDFALKLHCKCTENSSSDLTFFFHGCGNSATVEVSLTFSFIVGSNPPES